MQPPNLGHRANSAKLAQKSSDECKITSNTHNTLINMTKVHKRGRYSAALKEKVSLEALKGEKDAPANSVREQHQSRAGAPAKRKGGPRPYLLDSLPMIDVDKVWCSDITYLQIGSKNYYLCAVLDWASREVLGWSLSDNMSTRMCLDALHMALAIGRKPEIFNTDQGSQYTSHEWIRELEERGIIISMDGKGRWADNIAIERLWRTFKHDCFLFNEVTSLEEAYRLTARWFTYYNRERPHARLDNLSPSEYCRQKGYPPTANFLRDFSASTQLASLRSASSLRSERSVYATKSRKKWIDRPHCLML